MPSLGADMDEGTVVEWLVGPGDEIQRGDIVAVVDTDKSDIEIETFQSGTVERILVPPGQRVPVGTPLAVLGTSVVSVDGQAAPALPAPPAAPGPRPLVAPTVTTTTGPITIIPAPNSPVLRRLAHHLHVDLDQVAGTGPGGRVTRDDIEAAAQGGRKIGAPLPPPPPAGHGEVPRQAERPGMRSAIAALMSRSAREVPHYYVATDIDLSAALEWIARTNAELPVTQRLLPVAVILKATAVAARRCPELNGWWVDGAFQAAEHVHLGIATSLRTGGLVAPALHDVDEKGLGTIMSELRDLVQRARAGRLRSSEMSDPTLTVTNLGEQGVRVVYGLIYPPQVALVGYGRIAERPWAVGGMLGVRPVVTATLAGDHRATDGMTGARFLDHIDHLLQEPEQL
jgi:pyruvate dehydrogenase E2 component (dihydrolipoamide acetyltransferase)